MALSVLNNIASMTAQNNLAVTNNNLQNTLFQLSSGSRINSGADDPAGLSIADGLQANITALTQSSQNAANGVGQLQVADGALSQVTTLLNRAVTLATEAANGGLTTNQFASITNEYGSIVSEINRIGNATNFNGNAVFSSTTAPNLSQAASMAQSSLSAGQNLTAGTTTTVQIGNQPAYTFTAGASGVTALGSAAVTTGTNLTSGQTISLTNGSGTFNFTAQTLTETGATAIAGGADATTSADDNITITAANSSTQTSYAFSNSDTVANMLTALNANTATNGVSAYLDASNHLVIQGTAAGGSLTISGYDGAGLSGASFTATQSTVGDLMTAINKSADNLTATISGGKLQVTSANGNVSNITNGITALGTVAVTNNIQDLINGINGSGLGVTASLVSGVQNKNQLVSSIGSLTGSSAISGTIVLNSGASTNGQYANSYTFNPATAVDPILGGSAGTVQTFIDSVNSSNSGFHAFLQNGKLEITDGSYSGNASATFSGTIGGNAATFANPAAATQLEITDPLNRGNLTVTNNDSVLGYVANTASNPLEGGNADSFVAPGQTSGSGGAQVFINDGDVTNSTYNTINVQVGLLNANQIGNNTTTLSTQNLGTASGAASALTVINSAISDVAAMRGTIGAGINRLNSATNVINTQVQNLTSAQSSIHDANVGQVVASLSKYQILEQTGISALAQANQNQQSVLKLLQ